MSTENERVGGDYWLGGFAPKNDDGTFFYVVTKSSWGRSYSHLCRAKSLKEAKNLYGWTRERYTSVRVRRACNDDVAKLREES